VCFVRSLVGWKVLVLEDVYVGAEGVNGMGIAQPRGSCDLHDVLTC